jgi:HSP20 family molecular chaperone IbpA
MPFPYNALEMAPSSFPFHGIFSSLGQSDEDGSSAFGGQQAQDGGSPIPAKQSGKSQGQVAVDIYEQDGYYIIKAPIAGVRLSDIDIEISDNVLTIRGARVQSDANVAPDQYYLQECFWGEFHRSITLPFSIDPKKVRATFNKECILKILIPKEEKVKIVRINEA